MVPPPPRVLLYKFKSLNLASKKSKKDLLSNFASQAERRPKSPYFVAGFNVLKEVAMGVFTATVLLWLNKPNVPPPHPRGGGRRRGGA